MPGFELTRLAETNFASDLRDLTCDICQDMFYHPVVTSCCGATFCESCIKPWIESSHTCPSDYKPLKAEGLMPPPVVFVKLLNKQKVKCNFAERGCTEVSRHDG